MIDLIKRILAIAALICFAAFLVITIWMTITGELTGNYGPMLIPLACFLGLGLLSLGIRWLQNLKKEELEKAQKSQQTEETNQ